MIQLRSEATARRLVEDNLGLLYCIAIEQAHQRNRNLGEYIALGWEAMLRSALVFDPELGTYSAIARRSILNAISNYERTERRQHGLIERFASGEPCQIEKMRASQRS